MTTRQNTYQGANIEPSRAGAGHQAGGKGEFFVLR